MFLKLLVHYNKITFLVGIIYHSMVIVLIMIRCNELSCLLSSVTVYYCVVSLQGLFRRYVKQGLTPEEAFLQSSESITGPITKTISKKGILNV